MKTILQILFCSFLTISCKENSQFELYSMKRIESDSKPYKTDEIVLVTYPSIIFIKTNIDKTIARPEYDDLITLHSKYYSSQSLDSFLYSILNLKLKTPIEYINELKIQTFKINNEVENKIQKNGIENFINEITELRNNKKFLKKNLTFNNEDGTIEYILYKNKFVIVRDDYSALSWVEKRTELPLYIE